MENSSWTPNVTIKNTIVTYIPTRGILVTTKGKVIIEGNTFLNTEMSSILIADDANSWFESGYVRDVTISNNRFITCGEPVINIHPENSKLVEGQAVHKNITIINNFFLKESLLLTAKSTKNIKLVNNRIEVSKNFKIEHLFTLNNCTDVSLNNNKIDIIEKRE